MGADSEDCSNKRTWWVFTADPNDIYGVKAIVMDDILMAHEKKVYIRSRRPHHPALRCGNEVFADQFENATEMECFTLKHLGNDTYYIIGEGWYLQASPNGEVSCSSDGEMSFGWNRSHPNDEWKIEYTRKGYVSIKSCYNKYLCADENFCVTANRECCELWEQWAIVDEPHLLTTPVREVYIRSCRQQSFRYDDALPALNNMFKATNHGQAKFNEKWHMMCIDDNKVALFTHVDQCRTRTYLAVDRAGSLIETKHIYPDEKIIWTIENVEGASKSCFALRSFSGSYLRCDNGDHFLNDGSVKADSDDCGNEGTWWVFTTDPSDICGIKALEMDDIVMKNRNKKFS